jgi:hypothetical protein
VAHPQIAVFAREADGAAQRIRAIEGTSTLLGRTMHGMAYDEIHDEIIVPQQFGQGILTFAGGASGATPPKRVISGSKTRLIALDKLAIDPVNNEIYVPEGDEVLVFPREATGNVAPARILTGPNTRIVDASAVGVDPIRNLTIVLGSAPGEGEGGRRRGNELKFFPRTASGDAKPTRLITGVQGGRFFVEPKHGLIFVVANDYIGVYRIEDEGAAPLRFTLGGPKGILVEPRAVTVDLKNKTVIVTDKSLNAAMTFSAPEIFEGRPMSSAAPQAQR